MTRVCRCCQKEILFKFSHWFNRPNKKKFRVFIDSNGRTWCGRLCPTCRNQRDIKRSRRLGIHRSIDDQINPIYIRARAAEKHVAELLRKKGMTNIELTTAHGPDITFLDGGVKRTCEVKTILKDPNGDSWFTAAVYPKRKGDDYFAAVFPNGEVLLESMSIHLRRATKCGRRTFTREVRDVRGA